MELCQGSEAAADYAIRFHTLAAQSGWNDAALWAVFRAGLNPSLQAELVCHMEATSLSQFVAMAIQLDNLRLQHQAGTQASAATRLRVCMDYPDHREEVPESRQLGRSRLAAQGHRPRGQMRLCYHCGASGHLSPRCPERPSSAQVGGSSSFFNLPVPVMLHFSDRCVLVSALIDSGATVNLINGALVEELGTPTFPCVPALRITAIDSQPIGEGYLKCQTELLERAGALVFYLSEGVPTGSSVKALEDFLRGESDHCSMRTSSPPNFREVLSEERVARLPSHQVWDCAIDLLPNASPPKGRIYPFSLPESKAMEDYIETALAAGHIRLSTSPAAAGFFFVGKRDGGLRPCIDYRGLNAITVQYPYPLTLVPTMLEQLRGAKVFTKLDLRSAYNLVCIRKGNEWKTTFHTTCGHYEYCVMPFGLTNAPAVFQALINKVFRDLLGKGVIAYIDDILVYSTSMEKHVRQVREVLTRLQRHHLSSWRNVNSIGPRGGSEFRQRHWLEGARHPFQVLTDHRNLEYLWGAKRLNARQARWAMFLTRLVFMVTYCPGSKNGKADALSRQFEAANEPRQPDLILPATAILAPVQWDLVEEIWWAHANERLPPAVHLLGSSCHNNSSSRLCSGCMRPPAQGTQGPAIRPSSPAASSGGPPWARMWRGTSGHAPRVRRRGLVANFRRDCWSPFQFPDVPGHCRWTF
ncbi:hypothetical protein QTP70_001334 [Hemibagrus guttatus]|uniref:ribonuclease H n=1 Tax=Hemibagrus guttatus TaxID=175788 RepID=A0AAE0PQF3_9TELE|nr:hypothetical protein QTP70_001334 [Hemibagrus guttatus]